MSARRILDGLKLNRTPVRYDIRVFLLE